MQEADFVFRITPYDTQALLPQVSKALEKRTELVSRRACPGIWKQTDRLRAAAKGKKRSPLRTRIRSGVCLVLGIILLVPGILEPDKLFVPLIVGAAAVAVGLGGFWTSRRKRSPFEAPAEKLLSGLQGLPENQHLCIALSAKGMMTMADGKESETVPWDSFECAVEAPDILLFVYGEKVVLVQKKDLVQGEQGELGVFLAARIENYHLIGKDSL